MKTFYFVSFFLFTFYVTQAQWTNQNFGGGRDVFFIDDNTGWISYGGSIQFIDQNTGWICGGGGVKKTTNAGADWINKSGASGKIIKTIDGGENWFELPIGTTETLTDLYFCGLNIGYLTGYNGTILKTTDGGLNWVTQHSDSTNDLFSVDFVDALVGYAVGGRDSIYFLKTTDGGLNWNKKTLQLGYIEGPQILNCVEFIDATVGWVGSGGNHANLSGRISKTTDGGETWISFNYSRPISEKDTIIHQNEQEDDPSAIRQEGIRSIYFKDANNGYAVGGTSDGWQRIILSTTDAGTTWQSKYAYSEQTGLLSVFVTGAGKGWALGYSGVVYITEDNGYSWTQILSGGIGSYTGDRINCVFMINDNVGWAAGSRKGIQIYPLILKTTNGGKIWKTIYERNNSWNKYFSEIFFINENVGWVCQAGGAIYKTTNGGENWISINPPGYDGEIFFINQDTGWAATTWGVSKSTNGGIDWVLKNSTISHSLYFSNINNGWATGLGGSILKSIDEGESWVSKTSGTTSNFNSINFHNNNVGICVGNSGTILLSTNGGESWNPKTIGTTADLYSVAFTNMTTAWIAGSGGTLQRTTDLGNSWISYSISSGNLTSLHFLNEYTGWVVDGNNNIFKYSVEPPPSIWANEILVKDAGGTESSEVLTIGQDPNATDNLDLFLGEYELPPPPASGIFDARLNLPTNPVVNSLKDYRDSSETQITWTMTYQPGSAGYPMTLSWDSTAFPEGTFYLKDRINGSFVNVNMKKQNSYTLIEPSITSLDIRYTGIFSSVLVNNDWNMISVPLRAEDMSLSNLFPTATSLAYGFDGGYVTEDTLVGGKGYWLKFSGNEQIQICGSVSGDSVNVKQGWNMFGGYKEEIPISQLTTIPPGIIATYFFGFNDGYNIADTLKSGQGYWVRVTQDGVINLNSGGLIKEGVQERFAEIDKNWGKIKITDNKGKSIALYASEEEIESNFYDLPPMPPTGIFDTRYSSGRLVENLSSEKTIMINSDNYPITIRTEGINLTIRDRINGEILNEELKNGEELRITNNKITSIKVTGNIMDGLPVSYELYQNYPNPFNPSTTIKFAVPKESNVNLTIYNVLGELVTTLVNEQMKAGYYEYKFDASNLASGVYLFRIKAGDFLQTKKMILLK